MSYLKLLLAITIAILANARPSAAAAQAYDVQAFGAVPNDGTDDTTKIQDAIDAANAANGGTILFPTGTYNIRGNLGLDIYSHITLSFEPGAELVGLDVAVAGVPPLIMIENAEDVSILGGRLVGTKNLNMNVETTIGVQVKNSSNVTIDGMVIEDSSLDGIYVNSASQQVTIRNATISGSARHAIAVVHASNVTIDGCLLSSSTYNAVDVEPDTGESVDRVIIKNCMVSSNASFGLAVFGKGGSVTNAAIIGNDVRSNGGGGIRVGKAAGALIQGNQITSNTGWGLYLDVHASGAACRDHTVAANKIESNTSGGIEVLGTSSDPCYRMTLTGNSIRSNGGIGIELVHAANSVASDNIVTSNTLGIQIIGSSALNNVVAANIIRSNTNSGVSINTSCSGTNLTGNSITENGEFGVRVNSSDDNNITSNRLFGNGTSANASYDNIFLAGSSNNNIQSNFCRQGTGSNKSRYGINISNSTSSTNVVTNNDLKTGGASGTIQDSGTSTVTAAGNRL